MKFKEGEYVKIIEREQTPADAKNGTFYPYFCNLEGTVDKIYDEAVCVNVTLETLPESVRKRHVDIQENIRRKWLNGLSGEVRNRLTPEEKQFQLAYTILVQSTDLQKAKPGQPRPAEIKNTRPLNPPEPKPKPVAETPAQQEVVEARDDEPNAMKTEVKEAAPAPAGKPTKPAAVKAQSAAGKPSARSAGKPEAADDLTPAELAFLKEREKALKAK